MIYFSFSYIQFIIHQHSKDSIDPRFLLPCHMFERARFPRPRSRRIPTCSVRCWSLEPIPMWHRDCVGCGPLGCGVTTVFFFKGLLEMDILNHWMMKNMRLWNLWISWKDLMTHFDLYLFFVKWCDCYWVSEIWHCACQKWGRFPGSLLSTQSNLRMIYSWSESIKGGYRLGVAPSQDASGK